MRATFFLTTNFLCILVSCKEREQNQREVSFYPNDSLRFEVLLMDGKRHGIGKEYFPNGEIKTISVWNSGKLDGDEVIFFENGIRRQINKYKEGRLTTSSDYSIEGFLVETRLYDSLQRIIDFFSYQKDGSRNFSREKKDPIFIPSRDTLILGETYSAEIRLGNRQYDNIEVILGDIYDPHIARKNPPLPKKDSLTSIINIKAETLGSNEISGIVVERSATSDSLDVIPFTHRFFVKPKN